MQEIYVLQQDSKSVTAFYSKLKVLWEELEIYLPMLSSSFRIQCACESMRTSRKNHMLLYAIRFLTGLHENFSMVKLQILLMGPLPPMTKIFSMVLQHERKVNIAPTSDDSIPLINGPILTDLEFVLSVEETVTHLQTNFDNGSSANHVA